MKPTTAIHLTAKDMNDLLAQQRVICALSSPECYAEILMASAPDYSHFAQAPEFGLKKLTDGNWECKFPARSIKGLYYKLDCKTQISCNIYRYILQYPTGILKLSIEEQEFLKQLEYTEGLISKILKERDK